LDLELGGCDAPRRGSDLRTGAKLKTLAGDGVGGEGPAWHPKLGLLTSGNGHICQVDQDGKAKIYRKGAGTNGCSSTPWAVPRL